MDSISVRDRASFWGGLRKPLTSRGPAWVTRLAAGLIAPFLISWVLTAVAVAAAHGAPHGPFFNATVILGVIGMLLLPVGLGALIVEFVIDRGRKKKWAVAARQERERSLTERVEQARSAMRSVYASHRAALEGEVARVGTPDRYGQVDSAAIAKEFDYFYQRVVEPELIRHGFEKELVAAVYREEKAGLIANVLR